MPAQLGVDAGGHVGVHAGHGVVERLDHRDAQPAVGELLGHLQADVPGSDDDGAGDAAILDPGADRGGIGRGTHREHPRQVHAGNWRDDGRDAGGQDELVVGVLERLARGEVLHADRARAGVDRDDVVTGADVDVVAGLEPRRAARGQRRDLLDVATDVVRQPAPGVGDLGAALVDGDPRGLGVAARLGGHGRARRDGADDDDLQRVHEIQSGQGAVTCVASALMRAARSS